jgi:nucleotide-binding universal stress UspA family protein
MQAVHSVLVPTDFSSGSKGALAYAIQLADTFGASLHVLHVMEDPVTGAAGYLEMYAPPDEYLEALERQVRAELESQLTPEQKTRHSAQLVLRMGAPANGILSYLAEHPEIDLVVMATAGRGGVARLVMGSVADTVVRAATCPVLTMHPHDPVKADTGNRAA